MLMRMFSLDLLANESSPPPRPTTANSRRNVVSDKDSSYVRLAKKGGDSSKGFITLIGSTVVDIQDSQKELGKCIVK